MELTATRVRELLENELAVLTDQRVLKHIRSLVVPPSPVVRAWDYGADGEAYPCWAVLNHIPSNTGIAYCASGFGPKFPWGLVFLAGTEHMSIGMDSGWFENFLQAYFESAASTEIPIWRVFEQSGDLYPGSPLTAESDWESTWREIERLRVSSPGVRYHCSQSVYHGET